MSVCIVCSTQFTPQRMAQHVCSPRCAIKSVRAKVKAEKADLKVRKDKAKPRSRWLQEAQSAFNAWIRARDAHLGCISCGTHNGKANAGHYLSTAARPELRLNEWNCHLQCERCNTYLHGNLIAYRANLIERIGLEKVKELEGPVVFEKLTITDLQAIRDDYRAMLKAMRAAE